MRLCQILSPIDPTSLIFNSETRSNFSKSAKIGLSFGTNNHFADTWVNKIVLHGVQIIEAQ